MPIWAASARVSTGRRLVGGRGEVVEPGRLGQFERAEDPPLGGGELGALRDGAFVRGEGDQAQAVELVADVAPRVVGLGSRRRVVAPASRAARGPLERRAVALQRAGRRLARIMVMTETMSLAAVKARFCELVDRVERQQDRVVVTRNGKPAAVLISPNDLESLEETLAIMSDRSLAAQIRESKKALAAGESGVGLDELRAGLDRRRVGK